MKTEKKKKVVGLFLAKAQLLEWWRQNAPKMAKSAGFGGCGTFALCGLPRNWQTTRQCVMASATDLVVCRDD